MAHFYYSPDEEVALIVLTDVDGDQDFWVVK
jgi:hypothetical protein